VLDRGGVLCSGIVVDQDGQPVAGAGVSIYLSSPGGWTGLPGDTVAGDDGSFKVLWEEPIEPGQTGLGVCASHPMASHGTNIVSFERGQEGLRLMVDVGGVIAGSFSPEEDVTILRPVLSMQRVGRSERQSAGIGSQFRVRAEPGLLTVVVLADGGAGDELLRLDNLLVERGVVTQDPRLQGMLFSANLQKATLRILDEGGQPLLVRATVQDIDQKHQWYSGRDGRVTLSRRLPGDWNLHVVAPGFRSIELRGVREDRDVVLRRGPLVRLEASDHAAIEALGAAVFVNLKEAGTESNRRLHMFGLDDVVPAIGGGTLRVENVGPHHVTWFVERQNPGNTTSRFTVSQETPETVHVADMETLQAFIVTPPLDALRKKIEEMKKE
jgi:hypothetical protein